MIEQRKKEVLHKNVKMMMNNENDDNENDYVMICCLRQPKRYLFVA